jgi:hypothetical protein
MKTSLIMTLGPALLGVTACGSKVDDDDIILNSPPGTVVDTDTRPTPKRPPPARSGMGSDPDNPSGAPGPGSGIGTSLTR